MKTAMTKRGLRFTVQTNEGGVLLSAQLSVGGAFYQWLLTREDAVTVGDMLSEAAFAPAPVPRGGTS